ncbi:MAG TPA: hypothetical protein VG838_03605 [Opitutaceae bacterium]|nr:hypothetical protein [Opitutaceae bacterium]
MKPLSRLILCDGLPGSGKTTTTQQLWLHLDALGHEARWWFEHELDHPVIGFDQARAAQRTGGAAAREIFAGAHAGWAALASRTGQGHRIALLEGTLFQATVGAQLLADLPRAEIVAHFERTLELIAPLDPVLIHLRQENVGAALAATSARRGSWFPEFLQGEFAATARGRRVGRSDAAALLEYFTERREVSDELFARFPGRKLAHENSDGDWTRQGRAITDFLGLPPMPVPPRPERAEEFAGRYRAGTGDEWIVAADPAGLRLDSASPARLLPRSRDRFVIEGLCVEVTFQRSAAGAIEAIACAGNLPDLPPRWARM